MSVHTNRTITVQRGNKVDRMNIQRVKPFEEDLDNEKTLVYVQSKNNLTVLYSHQTLPLRLVVSKLTTYVTSPALY
jgi:hypothetical protein